MKIAAPLLVLIVALSFTFWQKPQSSQCLYLTADVTSDSPSQVLKPTGIYFTAQPGWSHLDCTGLYHAEGGTADNALVLSVMGSGQESALSVWGGLATTPGAYYSLAGLSAPVYGSLWNAGEALDSYNRDDLPFDFYFSVDVTVTQQVQLQFTNWASNQPVTIRQGATCVESQ